MSIIRTFFISLIYIISLSYALQCTTDCFFTLPVGSRFEIPAKCNKTISAKQCQIDLSTSYDNSYISVSLSAFTYSLTLGDNHFVMVQISEDALTIFYYSITRYCKNKDDCAQDLGLLIMFEITNRPPVDSQAIGNELVPILSSNFSIENSDLLCFDTNERVRQCSIPSKPGACQSSQSLIGKKQITRSCNNKVFIRSSYVTILDSGKIGSFSIECNRLLCNGPMTLQAVKEIMFKYNVTKTMEGRLINHGLRSTLSSTFAILIIIISFVL